MSTTDHTGTPSAGAPADRRAMRALARRALWRLAPGYARRRSRRIAASGRLDGLERELVRLHERHGEQIERLEDLVRELVLAVEALRRQLPAQEPFDRV